MFEVKDKVVLVTGGSGGLGGAICDAFQKEGAIVYNADIKQQERKDMRFIKTDLTKEIDLKNLVTLSLIHI